MRTLVVSILGLCSILKIGLSSAATDVFIADAKSGCKVYKPNTKPKETVSWSGSCTDGFAEGLGIAQWSSDGVATVKFQGQFKVGRLEGKGTMSAAEGDRYDGQYKAGKRDGVGTYVSANGERYEGEYQNNSRTGKGILTDAKGNKVAGVFRDGVLSTQANDSNQSTTKAVPNQDASLDLVNQAKDSSTTNIDSDRADLLDGSWYGSSGIGFKIQNGKGIATIDNKMGHKRGDPVLTIVKAGDNLYKGQMFVEIQRAKLEWVNVKAAIYDKTLRIGTPDSRQYFFSKGLPPTLSNPYPSGTRFVVGGCGAGQFAAAVIDRSKVDFKSLPTGGQFNFSDAPEPLGKLFRETHEFMQKECGENSDRTQYPIFFQSNALPLAPLEIRDFDNADAKAYIRLDTASFSNRVAGDVIEAKKAADQKAAQDAVVARSDQSKRDRAGFAAKYGATELQRMLPLYVNPFALEGKVIIVQGYFSSMENRNTGLFSAYAHGLSDHAGTIVVSNLPAGVFNEPFEILLAIRVEGQTKLESSASGKAPLTKYVGHIKCPPRQNGLSECP